VKVRFNYLIYFNLEISQICDFWVNLNIHLTEKQISPSKIIENLSSIYKNLILGLMNLIRFGANLFAALNQSKTKAVKKEEEYKNISEYRKEIRLLFQEFSQTFGFNFVYFEILLPEMTQTIAAIKIKVDDMSLWAKLESEIYTFECICRGINTNI
jgi:hypothetical protein